jgi:hypothetical protein
VAPEPAPPRLEWRFDGAAGKEGPARGGKGLDGVADVAVRDGRLVGRTTNDFPILDFALPKAIEDTDLVHEIEVRLRVDAGGNVSATLGLDRRTLVVFTSDHGEEFLEHGRMFHGQNVYGHQNNVPLILWQPGFVPAGREVTETVQTIDIMPTLLAASGLAVPPAAQGHSLWELMAPAGGAVRAAAGGWPALSEKARTAEGSGAPAPHETASVAIVEGPFKLVHHTERAAGSPEYQLFDHRTDPLDLQDVAAKRPDVVARLARDLAAWQRTAEAARLKPDTDAEKALSKEELERLRALGYIQ